MTRLHRVFISFHHALDDNYSKIFELKFGNRFGAIIPAAVRDGDIDPNLKTETIRQRIRDDYRLFVEVGDEPHA